MEARTERAALLAAVLLVSMGAQQRSANFIVKTPDPNFARQVVQAAEQYRHDLAIEWLGQTMPNWAHPCVMEVQVGGGAGGATRFQFDRGEVFGWVMTIQGSRERILDSVLPHEITHMVYASHFRQPLPRWADEGGATSVENVAERNKHRTMLYEFLRTGRGIAFSKMFAMTEYPPDIMPLYAQGYSLAEFLIQTGGRRKYVEFLGDGLESDDWSGAIRRHYGIKDLGMLQNTWLAWVRQGSPPIRPRPSQPPVLLASSKRRPRPEPNLIYHVRDKQSPAAPLAGLVPVRFDLSPRPLAEKGHLTQDSPRPFAGKGQLAKDSPRPLAGKGQLAKDSPRPLGEGQGVRALAGTVPSRHPSPSLKWGNPFRPSSSRDEHVATADRRAAPTALPASGWRAHGDTSAATSPSPAYPAPTQVTHPQSMEQPRQTVLEE